MLYTICYETGHLFFNLVLAYVLGGLTVILVAGFEKEYKKALLNRQMRGAYNECNEDIDSKVYCIDEVTGDIEVFTDNTPDVLQPCPDRTFTNNTGENEGMPIVIPPNDDYLKFELKTISKPEYEHYKIRDLKALVQQFNRGCTNSNEKIKDWDRLNKHDLFLVLKERKLL